MSLIPTVSLAKLTSLRGREQMIHIVWGVTRWLTIAISIFLVAIFIDWQMDKVRETPFWVRALLMLVQLVVFSVAGLFWIILPWSRGASLIGLAKRVEDRIPEFDHRLITSIQLTRQGAQVDGMSPELIRQVTEEAETISKKHDLVELADTRRLKWSLALVAWPLAVFSFLLLWFGPSLLGVLLKRQFLVDVEIPRDVRLTTATKKNPWPAGDEVTVAYEVTSERGRLTKNLTGTVNYESTEYNHHGECDLVWDDQTDFSPERAIFKARIPHSSSTFVYSARLGDGRTKGRDEVTFEPRPQINIESVWVQSPEYVAGRPEILQTTKNIRAVDGSRARIRITVQKPIVEARLILYQLDEKGVLAESESRALKILEPVTVTEDSKEFLVYPAESDYFDLRMDPGYPRPVAYSIAVRDVHRFDSVDNPRGIIEITRPKTPYVKLLPERFVAFRGDKFNEDQVLEGFPVKLGGNIMVEYKFRSDIGACKPFRRKSDNQLIEPAWLVYRVNDGPWEWLKLNEVPETPETGPYDVDNATFANLRYQKEKLDNEVPFHAKPAGDAQSIARLEGGGFFEIRTEKLSKTDADGKKVPLEVNDRIGFYVAVYDCDPAANRLPGASDYREKTIKTEKEISEQAEQARKEIQKIQEITKRQQAIASKPQGK